MELTAAILGVVEGLTEFLPVSSTGHLILAGHFLRFEGVRAATFEIFIQTGAMVAVLLIYRERFVGLLDWGSPEGFRGRRGIWLLAITSAPAFVLGAALHGFIKSRLFNPLTVALGLAVGGLAILILERILPPPARSGLDALSRRDAFWIGAAQTLALWPGMSRSACTILAALALGYDRRTAVEYSFFAAVPILFAAAGFDLLKSFPSLRPADLSLFACGFAVSFFAAWAAVRFFLRWVSRYSLAAFGAYRLVLAAVLFLILP